MATISGVIITFNEEANIGRCLDSLQPVVDELIVVDSFSTDNTRAICEARGATFLEHPFEGHIQQKNYAWEQANSAYILSLDADEALSEALKASLLAAKPKLEKDGYAFNRLTNYCGQWIRHSGWYPDAKIRLFRKGKGRWQGTNPHDKYLTDDPHNVGHLAGDLLHYTFYTVEQHWQQVHKFTDISSQAMFAQGKRSSWLRIVFSPMAKFIRNYLLHRGFMDGKMGFQICRISAHATYLKYRKLLRLQIQARHER
ncbi:MAG: glycosyltransferase family 2 protein [Bacteroidota bacterium]